MDMRIRFSYIPLATLAATLVSGLGCGSAKKPVSPYLPPPQSAPPVQPKATAPAKVAAPKPTTETAKSSTETKPSATKAAAPETKPDPVQELITKAETEYKLGLDQSLAGHPEAAKGHFDRAFGVLLSASVDMRSDPRFQKEFDRVSEGVSTLEAAEQPAAEPAEQRADEENRSRRRSTKLMKSAIIPLILTSKQRQRPSSRPHVPICR